MKILSVGAESFHEDGQTWSFLQFHTYIKALQAQYKTVSLDIFLEDSLTEYNVSS
jgi:hypothetical protein